MSTYFPVPKKLIISPKIHALSFNIGDVNGTTINLTTLEPGAFLEPHQHPESQIGLALLGCFKMHVSNMGKILEPLQTAYVAEPHMMHFAQNDGKEPALGLDIKRLNIVKTLKDKNDTFLYLVKDMTLKTGIKMRFFVTSWCEIMLSEIPPGAVMPIHKHKNEQLGIAVKGKYIMTVQDENEIFEYGKVYYAPPGTRHGAYNPFPEKAISLNVFIPPRYNVLPIKERDI